MEVVGTIDACTPEAEALYASLLKGKLSSLQRLLVQDGTVPGFALDETHSSIRRFSRVSQKIGFAFVGFGIELTASELLSGEADVRVLGSGDISVAARGELSRTVQGPREGRDVSLVSTFDLLLARAEDIDGGGRDTRFRQSLSLGLTASHCDKSLKAGEVTGFLSRLSEYGLIRAERVRTAGEIYEGWSLTGGSDAKHPAGDMTVRMALGNTALESLLALGRAVRSELDRGQGLGRTRGIFELSLDAMIRTERISERALFDNIRDARRKGLFRVNQEIGDREWLLQILHFERQRGGIPVRKHNRDVASVSVNEGPRMADLTNALRSMSAFADILQLMAEIYDAEPAGLSGDDGWSEKDYLEHEKQLAASSREWLGLETEWFFWFDEQMSRKTVAFMLILVSLTSGRSIEEVIAGALGDPCLSIVMTPRTGPSEMQVPIPV